MQVVRKTNDGPARPEFLDQLAIMLAIDPSALSHADKTACTALVLEMERRAWSGDEPPHYFTTRDLNALFGGVNATDRIKSIVPKGYFGLHSEGKGWWRLTLGDWRRANAVLAGDPDDRPPELDVVAYGDPRQKWLFESGLRLLDASETSDSAAGATSPPQDRPGADQAYAAEGWSAISTAPESATSPDIHPGSDSPHARPALDAPAAGIHPGTSAGRSASIGPIEPLLPALLPAEVPERPPDRAEVPAEVPHALPAEGPDPGLGVAYAGGRALLSPKGKEEIKTNPPPPPSAALRTSDGFSTGSAPLEARDSRRWKAAEKKLRAARLFTAREAIAEAMALGIPAAVVCDLADFYRLNARAWRSPQVIRLAIRQWIEGSEPCDWSSWPPPRPEFEAERRRREEASAWIERAAAEREQRERDAEEAELLEAVYGAELDRLTPAKIERLRERAGLAPAMLERRHKPGAVRLVLLTALQEERRDA